MPQVQLAGAYDKYGAWLKGSAATLLDLAEHIRLGTAQPLALTARSLPTATEGTGWWTSTAPVTDLGRLVVDANPTGDGLVDIHAFADDLTISGSLESLSYLEGSIRNLASEDALTDGVDRHARFSYNSGHRWLSAASMELDVYLVVPERLEER